MDTDVSIFNKKRVTQVASLLLLGSLGFLLGFVFDSQTIGDGLAFFIFFLKFIGLCGFFFSAYSLLAYFKYFGFDRIRSVSLFIGVAIGILFILGDQTLTLFQPIHEFSIDARFRISSAHFAQEDVTTGVVQHRENRKAHSSIQIIGIDNPTVNEYQEGFPFSWKYYADLLSSLKQSNYKAILFDIFFLDQKKNIFDPKKKKKGKFSTYIEKGRKIVADYPFETNNYALSESQKKILIEKLAIFKKNEIKNVIPTKYDRATEWVKFPELPIPDIMKHLSGVGYANIRKQATGVNRTLPLVVKWKGKIYPSIDLITLAHYYGIDIQKDIEVKLGAYVKLKNIPKDSIQVYDRDSHGNILINEKGYLTKKKIDIMAKPNPERTITIPIDSEGFMYINFIGGPWSYPSVSFHTVASSGPGAFSGEQDPFVDKILLVAVYYATGVAKDIHASPFGDISGIEHHANALNTVLRANFLHYAPAWVNYLIYIIVGIVLGFIVPRFKLSWVAIGIFSFSILFGIECFLAFNLFNLIHVFFVPYIEIAVVMVGIVGYKAFNEEENVKYIKSTFSKFVSSEVVQELLDNPASLNLGGEEKNITVFFSDVRGFTTVAESLTPGKLVSLLNEYLAAMTEICLRYRGTIDKYMGDAIMAFWGAPIHDENHPYRACLASLVQLKVLKELQKQWKAEGKPVLDIGIGLNTGNAIVGNMGSFHRMDYTVMGDTINLGSRLEGVNKVYKTHIIISEGTYKHVKDKVISRELDLIRVKGKSEPVRIYELIDIKNQNDFNIFGREEK